MSGIVQLATDNQLLFRFPYDSVVNDHLRRLAHNRVRWSRELHAFTLPVDLVRTDRDLRGNVATFVADHGLRLGTGVDELLVEQPVRLRAAMLPGSTWGSNLRGILSQADWDRLRIPICDAADNKCEICRAEVWANGKRRRPDCHELWTFETTDDGLHVQRLDRLIALCPDCHRTQHVGLAAVNGEDGLVIQKLCRVNGWTRAQAIADLDRVSDTYEELCAVEWDLDLSSLARVFQ